MSTHERVPFRMLSCPECRFLMCWVNPRLPNFCPECGKNITRTVRERVSMRDDNAILTLSTDVQLAGGDYVEGEQR